MRPAFWRRKQRSTRNQLCGITFESSCAFQFFNQSNTPKGAPSHHMGAWGQTSDWRRCANLDFNPANRPVPESKWRKEEPHFSQTQVTGRYPATSPICQNIEVNSDRHQAAYETPSATESCGLGVRFRNIWNGHWWVHVRFGSVRCEGYIRP